MQLKLAGRTARLRRINPSPAVHTGNNSYPLNW